jgi:multisubunit Na+/H+ antiporter MnhB subunit
MRLAAIISIILIFLLIYRIGDLKKNTRGRYIYIAIFIGIIIVNGFILNDYVQVKSLHNYTTYITYQNLLNSIDDVNILKIEGISDVRVFSDSVNNWTSQVS